MTTTTLAFPHPTLTRIVGKPTAADVKTLKKQVYANARANYSAKGGGKHGHLRIVMSDTAYTALATEEYDVPDHPGAKPTHGDKATQYEICLLYTSPSPRD